MPHDQFDIFLSYHSGDAAWVIYLKSALHARGVRVWLDKDEIRPGDRFVDALEKGIESSRTVALIVSPGSLQSSWVKEEYERVLVLSNSSGVSEPIRLIPCLLRGAVLAGFLAGRQSVDFREPASFESKVDELCWGITGSKGRDPASHVAEAPALPVSPAEIEFLDRAIVRERLELRRLHILGVVAVTLGVGVSSMAGPLASQSGTWVYVGPPLFTALLGLGVTLPKWSKVRQELRRMAIQRDALELCLRQPAAVCPQVVEAFNSFIKQSIGVA